MTPSSCTAFSPEQSPQSRFDVVTARGLTPLVGRDAEVALLLDRWEQVKEGLGQVVLISGEPGIGKSRLAQALRERIEPPRYVRIEFRCSPYYQNSAFYPVLSHLQRFLGFRRDEPPEAKLAKLERLLQTYRFAHKEVVPLLATLFSLPHPERYPPLSLSPEKQKQQTQEALVAWLFEEAERQPVLVVWEDLHWLDPSSGEWLNLLMDQTATARLLLLLTARLEFRPPWGSRAHLTQLALPRFTRPQVEELVLRMTDGKRLPAEIVQQVVGRTDGVPLFVEELTKMVLESEWLAEGVEQYELTRPLPPLAIPATLQGSLLARLDRLPTAKEVAQWGATIGRQFTYEQLQAVAPWDAATLQHELTKLVAAELLFVRGDPPQATYMFKHALIQEAAYQSLLRSTRQRIHQRIAQVLETQFPETCAPSLNWWPITTQRRACTHRPCLLAAGWSARHRTLSQQRSRQSLHARACVAQDIAGHSRAYPTRTRATHGARPGVDGHQGPGCPGSGTRLRPGARVVSAGGPDPAALLGDAWTVELLFIAVGVTEGARAGGATPQPGPTPPQRRFPPEEPSGAGALPYSGVASLRLRKCTSSKGLPSTVPRDTTLWPYMALMLGSCASPMRLWPCGAWAIRTRPCRSHEARTLAHELAHPSTLTLALHFVAVLHQFAGETPRSPRTGRGRTCAL